MVPGVYTEGRIILETFVDLIGTVSVVVVLAYILTRSRFYAEITEGRATWRHRAQIVLLFGAFSIYGTIGGDRILGAIANIRDLGPVLAGLVGGPLVGVATGLIGGVHRYYQGGFTAFSCSLSTVLAGLLAGLYYVWRKGSFPGVAPAMLFMIGIESIHMGLNLLIPRPFAQALLLVETVLVPMVATNALGIGLFAFMAHNLQREKAAEKAKHVIEGELKAARDIQMSILPNTFPPFPDRSEFDLFAMIRPAREVGGDFYDFFFVGEDRLFVVIGDASGKGVPASLFMAVTKTLIKAGACSGLGPDKVLDRVNGELSRSNDSAVFATVFCATLDTRTGEVVYANGGHNPPYLVTADGSIVSLGGEPCPIVGAIEGVAYKAETVQLQPGEAIFFYTDGVPEATNKDAAFFSAGRLELSLASAARLPLRDVIGKVFAELRAFCDGTEQDDITMMAIRFLGCGSATPEE